MVMKIEIAWSTLMRDERCILVPVACEDCHGTPVCHVNTTDRTLDEKSKINLLIMCEVALHSNCLIWTRHSAYMYSCIQITHKCIRTFLIFYTWIYIIKSLKSCAINLYRQLNFSPIRVTDFLKKTISFLTNLCICIVFASKWDVTNCFFHQFGYHLQMKP